MVLVDFPAKSTVYTPYIYGSGQPYKGEGRRASMMHCVCCDSDSDRCTVNAVTVTDARHSVR